MGPNAESVIFLLVIFIAVVLSVTGVSAQERIKMDENNSVSVVIETAGIIENLTVAAHTNSTDEGNWILLENGKSVLLPDITFRYESVSCTNYTRNGTTVTVTRNPKSNNKTVFYPYKHHQVYTPGSVNNITGVFYGSTCFANKNVDAHLINITASDMLNMLDEALHGNTAPFHNLLNESFCSTKKTLNETGDAKLDLGRPIAGEYMIVIINRTNRDIQLFAATLVHVLKYELAVTVSPLAPQPGDFIDIAVALLNATDWNYSYHAILLHEDDYRAAIVLQSNVTIAEHGFNISLNNVWLNKTEITGLDRYTLIDIIEKTTKNASVGFTKAKETTASLTLITEANMKLGEYVLLVLVNSPDEKLVALNQTKISFSSMGS
jgi:methanogen extracellular protein (TIGR04279 family)